MEVPALTDGTVLLDAFTDADAGAHLAGEDEEHARRFGWYPERSTPQTVAAAFARWAEDWRDDGDTRAFAVRLGETRELVGGVQLRLRPHRTAQVSYWTFPEHRGRGIATRALRLACAWAVGELGIERVEAFVEPDNEPSLGVVRGAGFVEEGLVRSRERLRGERRDMLLFSRLPSDG